MKKYIIVAILAILAFKWIETNPFSQFVNTGAMSSVYYSQAELNQSQARLTNLPVEIVQTYKTGAAAEFVSDIAAGDYKTNAEKFASTLFTVGAIVVIAISMLIGALFLIVLIRLTTSTITRT